MVRTVNEAAHAQRRKAILDAAQQAVITKGYEQVAIADILSDLQISSGAFYHYFDSKPALLLALVERMGDEVEQVVLPIIEDLEPGALQKLQRFFAALDQWKFAHKRLILAYLPVWYGDENAIVRHKLYQARVKRLTPWLTEIIQQGAREGIFTTPYPDQTARIVIALLEDVGSASVELLLAEKLLPEDLQRLQQILFATTDALERLLGAPAGCLQTTALTGLTQWLATHADS